MSWHDNIQRSANIRLCLHIMKKKKRMVCQHRLDCMHVYTFFFIDHRPKSTTFEKQSPSLPGMIHSLQNEGH